MPKRLRRSCGTPLRDTYAEAKSDLRGALASSGHSALHEKVGFTASVSGRLSPLPGFGPALGFQRRDRIQIRLSFGQAHEKFLA